LETRIEKILIAPLDWGLGHATRCIPLIRIFLLQGKEVLVASSGPALVLLQEEFPSLEFIELPAYDIHYKHDSMALNMVIQLPKMRSVIMKESQAVQRIVEEHNLDLIISDNRYGIHHPDVTSVFIGHQLAIQMPKSMKPFGRLTLKWHTRMLEPFDQIWVPDFAATPNLSGALSHNVDLKNKLFFIGPLSRFDGLAKGSDSISLLIILSGQEPQRTELENIVLSQITDDMQSVVLVRGLPNRSEVMKVEQQNLKVYNHLPAQELERLIADSSIVLCRSGYSSIMDMAAMGKQVLLIPTPGQTEQEYLANYLSGKGLAFSVLQNELDLSSNLQSVVKCKELSMVNTNLEEKLEQALKKL
jgi:uncharacterized protein (TIGR00661 family)